MASSGGPSGSSSMSSRLANFERAGRSKKRRTGVSLANTTFDRSYTGFTTVSDFTRAPSNSSKPFTETKIVIAAPRIAPPILTLPPVDAPWHFEEISATREQHGGFQFVAQATSDSPRNQSNPVCLSSPPCSRGLLTYFKIVCPLGWVAYISRRVCPGALSSRQPGKCLSTIACLPSMRLSGRRCILVRRVLQRPHAVQLVCSVTSPVAPVSLSQGASISLYQLRLHDDTATALGARTNGIIRILSADDSPRNGWCTCLCRSRIVLNMSDVSFGIISLHGHSHERASSATTALL
jgi:hypothetical protein